MDSIRGFTRSLLGLMQARVELFSVELQEEKLRAIRLMGWFAAAITLAVAGVLLAIGALAIFLWQIAGYAGLVGLALVTFGSGGIMMWFIHRYITHGPPPFVETATEFRKDMESFQENP